METPEKLNGNADYLSWQGVPLKRAAEMLGVKRNFTQSNLAG
jgi:hypothetical protein